MVQSPRSCGGTPLKPAPIVVCARTSLAVATASNDAREARWVRATASRHDVRARWLAAHERREDLRACTAGRWRSRVGLG